MEELALRQVDSKDALTRFQSYEVLSVRQRKRWLEILLSFEFKNSYDVFEGTGLPVMRVQEEGSGFLNLLKRMFLGPLRPFFASVRDPNNDEVVLHLKRPFRFIFHEIQVLSGSGEPLGKIEKKWSWIRKIYEIKGEQDQVIATIFGPFFRPWTFEILNDGRKIGMIQKRWSGLGKELFTDADNFGLDLREVNEPLLRALAFSATVLIDVVHFERAKG